jgi:DNA-binding NtrC family response regulator
MTAPETTDQKHSLLIVDDERDVLYSFRRVLGSDNYELLLARSAMEGLQIFRERRPDLVIMDVRMAEMDGIQALREMRKMDPKVLVIIMTAYASTQTAIEAMKAGAYDYILKPFEIDKIKRVIAEAIRSSDSMKSVVSYQPLLSREDHNQGIIGKSEAMQAVYKEIGRVAARNIPVLITGETGTGKELVARAIYHHSDRHERRFIAINCGAIPELLLESELFGHERGAFTGAHARKIGKFEVADGGTLFLDEIGELSVSTQTKLLRVIQEKEFERLGGSGTVKVNVRLIAATNRDLRQMIRDKQFREDLFYRLNVVNLRMPALRERKDDIPLLVEYFVERFSADMGMKVTVSEQALRKLVAYDWPGNVRELENAIKNSLVRVSGTVLLPEDLHLGEEAEADRSFDRGRRAAAPAQRQATGAVKHDLDSLMGPVFNEIRRRRSTGDKEDAFDLVERCLVREALMAVQGNQARAAKLLGITRSTLRKRMAKYGIQLKTNVEADSAGPDD